VVTLRLAACVVGALGFGTGCSDALPLADRVDLAAVPAGAAGSAGLGGAAGKGGDDPRCAPSTVVLAEDNIQNARDLGGIPLSGGRSVKCGMLFRGPPLTLTADGCERYEDLGVRVLVDLREEHERSHKPDATCATDGANVITAPLPIPYQVSGDNYIADLNTLDSMALIFHALGTEAGYPMYFHCTWGRDRTAVVAAVILTALGASREAIMNDYVISAQTVGAYPASLQATLDELERRGGVEGYYAELGVTAEELAFLREHATTR
jgi:protein-tyrosine phosphatase